MPEPLIRKGDLVTFRLGTRTVQGEITEDRGPIGIKGRHLYSVEFRADSQSDSLSLIELPADQLRLVRDAVPTK